jgi:outer membrane lipoprotein SlyB
LFAARKENNAMDSNTTTRLNPLLMAAAASVMVLSAVGVAALTGIIPSSKGQESTLQLAPEVVKPIEPAISHPVTQPAAKKNVVRKSASQPLEPVAAQAPTVEEAPKPQVLAGHLAVVESVREVKDPGEAKGVGAVAGGVVGGVVGNKLGKGKALGTIIGAAGGAFAGHQIEKHVRADKRWEIALRLDDGSQRTLSSEVEPAWRAGDRVRLVDDKLQPA